MGSSQHNGFEKVVVDSIHGDIHLTSCELEVIDTGSFQRLRHLKQLAMSQMAYPNATLTRFAHSLGVLAIMEKITKITRESGQIELSNAEAENLRLAALLHDIGHYPYSHLMERIDNVKFTEEQVDGAKEAGKPLDRSGIPYPEHDTVGTYIVTKQKDIIDALGGGEKGRKRKNLSKCLSLAKMSRGHWLTYLIAYCPSVLVCSSNLLGSMWSMGARTRRM